jgi:hypothetical protein
MTSHPWLAPSAALARKVGRTRAAAALRQLSGIAPHRLGAHAAAWPPFLAALPTLLRTDADRVLDVVARVDVLSTLFELAASPVDADRLERALLTVWLGLAGHPGLRSPLVLPGPFRTPVLDPRLPRLLIFGDVRGLVATAHGPVVVNQGGRLPIERFVKASLPAVDGTVIVDAQLAPPDPLVRGRVRAALGLVGDTLPGGRLERVTIGAGDAAYGEARVAPEADAAEIVASAQAAFVGAAAAIEPMLGAGGVRVEGGRRWAPIEILARACGNAVALPWRSDHAAAASAIADDLDDLTVLADPTRAGSGLLAAVRALSGDVPGHRRHALLVNVDADDFVYSFQFGCSVERRCAERGLQVDRIAINPSEGRDLATELGEPVPAPVADGTELLVDSAQDPALAAALRRLSTRRYEVVVANVRPALFHDLLAHGLFAAPTLLWDRHLHGGLRDEGARRGVDPRDLGGLPIHAWSLDKRTGPGLQPSLADAGFQRGCGHVWPIDLGFFQSTATAHPNRLFAGGDNQRDWPLFIEAIRDLPLEVQLVTRHTPAALPAQVTHAPRLPLWRFRDAMASAAVTAIPLVASAAAGVSVIPMAMALGVAVVATRTPWTEPLVTDGEEGLLVPAGDVGAFRNALIRLHEEPDLRARLAANARRRVAALCDLEAFTREMFATWG